MFEFVPGGEIFRILRKEKLFPNDVALFYATEVIAAIAYLHQKGIVYRDMKPENILLGLDGHVKLSDMGFAKKIDDGKTFSVCGTPEYLAPEIIV